MIMRFIYSAFLHTRGEAHHSTAHSELNCASQTEVWAKYRRISIQTSGGLEPALFSWWRDILLLFTALCT